MIINALRCIAFRLAVAPMLPFLMTGCFFNLGEHKDFASWYYGDPGMAGALGEAQCDRYADRIQGERHRYYLHLRTPEVLLQPQGGEHYPARLTAEGHQRSTAPACEQVPKGWETFPFDTVDAGLVDTVIPYRKDRAVNDRERGFGQASRAYAEALASNTGLTVVMKAPIYIIHDILKTLYIPVAGTYYLLKPDDVAPTPEEIIQAQEAPWPQVMLTAEAGQLVKPAIGEATPAVYAAVDPMPIEGPTRSATMTDEALTPWPATEVEMPETAAEDGARPATRLAFAGDEDGRAGAGSIEVGEQQEASPAEATTVPTASGEPLAVDEPGAFSRQAAPTAAPPSASEAEDTVATDPVPKAQGTTPWPPGDEVLGIPIPPASAAPASAGAPPPARGVPGDDAAEPKTTGETRKEDESVPTGGAVGTRGPAQAITPGESGPARAMDKEADVSTEPADDPQPDPTGGTAGARRMLPEAAQSPEAGRAVDSVDATRPETSDAAAAIVDQTGKVAAAAAALATAVRMTTGSAPATTSTLPGDRPTAGGGTGGPQALPPEAPPAEIFEEDLRAAEGATDGDPTGASASDLAPPVEPKPSGSREASGPVARVAPDPPTTAPQAPSTLEPIEWVRIDKYQLQKKVAFIGFFSRSANVDDTIKAYLQDHLWPIFRERCDDGLMLMGPGDTGYPAALDSLVRDQFGRLNSFELTTVARFGGLNAIVAATIIDIRVASEISGILWYKTPEGQLRLTLLVEVFDAETGTKLLDRTYIREEEVEELEPGTGEAVRPGDRPVLEATLRSVAEDMGEHVCATLNELPWRAYVTGITGERVSLSAGEKAGLVPGNILKVYNSQIIDGLNNQQFFLTGENVGRIQIIAVFPNRSEALIIEGEGLRDYSVVIP